MPDSVGPHRRWPTRLPRPWDSLALTACHRYGALKPDCTAAAALSHTDSVGGPAKPLWLLGAPFLLNRDVGCDCLLPAASWKVNAFASHLIFNYQIPFL